MSMPKASSGWLGVGGVSLQSVRPSHVGIRSGGRGGGERSTNRRQTQHNFNSFGQPQYFSITTVGTASSNHSGVRQLIGLLQSACHSLRTKRTQHAAINVSSRLTSLSLEISRHRQGQHQQQSVSLTTTTTTNGNHSWHQKAPPPPDEPTLEVRVHHCPLGVDGILPPPEAHKAAVPLSCPLLVGPGPHDLDRVHLAEGGERLLEDQGRADGKGKGVTVCSDG